MVSAPLIQQYDTIWKGQSHRDFCVSIKDGKATVKVDGLPDYQLYFVQQTPTSDPNKIFAQGLETDGKIAIETPDAPHTNGHVCLGIAT